MHDVFISYSTQNTVIADAICHRLEAGGVRCWYAPRDVEPGKSWAGELMRAIRKAKVFLLIYSKDYNQSRQVISELTEAVDAGCTIVPFRVDQSDMNDDLAFYLKRIHWLDAINPPTQKQIETLYGHVAKTLGATPNDPIDPEEAQRQKEEEIRRKEEQRKEAEKRQEAERQKEAQRKAEQRKKRGKVKKILLKTVLPLVLALCLCVGGVWMFRKQRGSAGPNLADGIRQTIDQLNHQTGSYAEVSQEKQDGGETATEPATEPAEPVMPDYQTISFLNLSRLPKYRYPFFSTHLISSDGSFILLEHEESGTFTLARTDNGSVYRSGINLPDFEDLQWVVMLMSDGYDTIYFVDLMSFTVSSYNHVNNEWIQQGKKLELKDTEYIFTVCGFMENMMEENTHKEELGVLIYDSDPAVDCISKLITVRPDGAIEVKDISQAGLVNVINGVDRAGYSATLMVDKHRNLRVLDDETGAVLDISHEEILREYLPYTTQNEVICEDNRYYLSYENNQAQVWDLQTGSRVYSRTFAQYSCVYFSGPHEIIVYNGENRSVFVHDLETGRETVLMDENDFLAGSESVFMDDILQFQYNREHDLCVFSTSDGYNEQGEAQCRIIVTDRAGNIVAASEELTTYNGSHSCSVFMLDNLLLADMTLANWNTAQPEDGIITELFRAEFTVDDAGNLIFK